MLDRHPGLIDLEDALIADHDHRLRDMLLERLSADGREVKQRLDRGLPPREAALARNYLEALYASHQTIRAVWHYHHAER